MAILQIRKYPDRVLSTKASEVEDIGGEIVDLANSMLETMYKAPGIGLAAPQVGRSIRLIVFDIGHTEGEPEPHIVVNPVITASEGEDIQEEGCLSLPGIYASVKRAYAVELKGYDLEGREITMQAEGLLARVIQHEVDHLDGKLFVDRMSKVRRNLLLKRYFRNLEK